MMALARSLFWALVLLFRLSLVAAVPTADQIRSELGPKLSPETFIYDTASPEFEKSASRWQPFSSPNISIVVDAHTENDVVATIIYANNNSIPFLATTGGHGTFGSLGGLKNGLQIRLRSMNRILISADGQYATMQGGVSNLEVIKTLDAASKETVTGACECTGVLGAALGGGHGFHQGHYGLMADNIIDARVVLASGEVVNVSATTNTDLFWGLKGAGHNFGVVTEFNYKIYDKAPHDLWYTETFFFSTDKLEAVFTQVNKMMADTPPVELSSYSTFMHLENIDPVNPVILLGILYHGPESDASKFTTPFRNLAPLSSMKTKSPATDLPEITGNSMNSEICERGLNRLKFPIRLQRYDVPTLQKVLDSYRNLTASTPALKKTILLFEAYSLSAVLAVDETTTAFPHRGDRILATPVISFEPNTSLDAQAIRFGTEVRALLYAGNKQREQHAYINYAHGDEELTHIYGYDVWRRTKLRALKKKYDASNAFSWYAPIITSGRWR